jgi:hypothetical protein
MLIAPKYFGSIEGRLNQHKIAMPFERRLAMTSVMIESNFTRPLSRPSRAGRLILDFPVKPGNDV